jgi:hypothetical protein
VGLICELPPVALAEFYSMLQEDGYANRLRARFELLGEEPELLEELAELYSSAHAFRVAHPGGFGVLETLDLVHMQLATWLISVLPGPSVDFSQELYRRSQEPMPLS